MGKAKKTLVFGLDAVIAELLEKWIYEGKLPNFARLVREGVIAKHCLVPLPTLTPPNWTTIATGAWPGTHGITDFTVHHPGDPLDKTCSGFNSNECLSEYIWTAAEKVGKRSILIKWPASWPPKMKRGIQIDGCHVHDCIHEIDGPHLFSTVRYPKSIKIELKRAEGWKDIPESFKPPLETEISLGSIRSRKIVGRHVIDEYFEKKVTLHVLIIDSNREGYDQIIVARKKDASKPLAKLREGEWTDWIFLDFPGSLRDPILSLEKFPLKDGSRLGAFRLALLKLSRDGKILKIYSTSISPDRGLFYPENIGPELTQKIGPFPIECGFFGVMRGWLDVETFIKVLEDRYRWFVDASKYLMRKYNWDLYFIQFHSPDLIAHVCLHEADPLTAKSEEESQRNMQFIEKVYRNLDESIGEILEEVDEDALKIVVSDHGAHTYLRHFSISKVLEDAGLLTFRIDPKTRIRRVDWSKTKAYPVEMVHIYVNLKGRDPNGIVKPGEEYEKVRDQIINALCNCRDPETGKKVFSIALRKEDARILGLYGERVGDVIYAVNPEFGHIHGNTLPTSKIGIGSMRGTLIISGPGIKKNYVLKKTVWLTQIAPTISYLMGIPIPKDAEGAVIYEALEDTD